MRVGLGRPRKAEFPCPQPSSAENSRCRSPRARTKRSSLSATFTAAATCSPRCSTKPRASRARLATRASSFSATSSTAARTVSARSIWRSAPRRASARTKRIALMGNHEAMMRLALDPATPQDVAIDALETWIANGGDRTLAEFIEADDARRISTTCSRRRACRCRRASRDLARELARQLALGRPPVRPRRRQPALRPRELSSPTRGTRRLPASTKTATGPGCAGRSSSTGRGRRASAAISSSTATPRTTQARRVARGSDPPLPPQPRRRLGLTGVAKMAIFRGRRAEVVTARGPSNRELIGE